VCVAAGSISFVQVPQEVDLGECAIGMCVAVCCSVLQFVAECVLQCVLQSVGVRWSLLQCDVVC